MNMEITKAHCRQINKGERYPVVGEMREGEPFVKYRYWLDGKKHGVVVAPPPLHAPTAGWYLARSAGVIVEFQHNGLGDWEHVRP